MATQFSASEGRNWKTPFFTIWAGQAISLLGSRLVQFALIWYLTVQTGSATVLATASLVGMLPYVVLSPFVGVLVDRWNRRSIMIVADTVIALATATLAVLFALGVLQFWHIYLMLFVRAVGGSFHNPAMTASTSLMVPKEHFTRVQGINQTLQGGLNILSAPLGALLLEVMPVQGVLAIDVVTAALAVTTLLFINIPQPERIEKVAKGLIAKTSIGEDLRVGLRYVFTWPGLVFVLGMAALLNFLLTPAGSLLPLLIKEHFGGGALQLGWVEAAHGAGVILGGLGLSVWGGFKRRIVTSLVGIFGLGIGTLMMGFAPASLLAMAIAAFLLMGIMLPIANGPLGAIMQAAVDPEMQGRVLTLVGSVATGVSPIGLMIAGPVADAFGIQTWFLLGGGLCIILSAVAFFVPAVMNIEEGRGVDADAPAGEGPETATIA